MQRLDPLNCLDTLRQTLDRWHAIAPPPPKIMQQLQSLLQRLDGAIEQLQLQTKQSLTEREELLHTVVTNTPTILYAMDRQGVFTLSEGKGLAEAALKPGQLVGQSVFDVYGKYDHIIAHIQKVFAGVEHRAVMEIEGSFYDNQATPMRDAEGKVIGIIGVATDITARLQIEAALQQSKADLEQRVEARTAELQSINAQLQQEIAQRKQIEQSLRESQVCLRLINTVSTGITAGLSVEQLIASTIEQAGEFFPEVRVQYCIITADQFQVLHSVQPPSMVSTQGWTDRTALLTGISDFTHLEPIVIPDVFAWDLPLEQQMRMAAKACRALLLVPVQHSAHQIGYIGFNAAQPRQWSHHELTTLVELADYLSIALQKVQAQAERQRTEERLRLFESVVVNGNDAVLISNADPEQPLVSYVNAAFTEMTGFLPEEVIGKTPRMLQGPKTDRTQLNRIRSMLMQGRPVQSELINYRKDGSEFWVDLNIVPIANPQGTLTHFVALQRDITDRKWSEKAFIATQTRLKYLLSSNPSVIYTCQPNRNRSCTFVSENIALQLGYEIWNYLKDPHFWVDHVHPDDLPAVLENSTDLLHVGELTCEYRFLHQDGQYRWLRDSMKLTYDRQGQPLEVIGAIVDITDRKWAEDRIRASLQEKEVMLKEIHHRVKNNLQVVSSLLKLQAGYSKDAHLAELLKESQNRIRAMALIHEKLYQSEDLAKTNFAEYIRSLVTDLFRSYAVNAQVIQLELSIEAVRLTIDTAIPCGLILNELISNSLKYAFPAGRPGKIRISLHAKTDGQYVLVVGDDGIGLPDALEVKTAKSLGLQLVDNLTQQLHGSLALDRHPGTTFTVVFSESKSKG